MQKCEELRLLMLFSNPLSDKIAGKRKKEEKLMPMFCKSICCGYSQYKEKIICQRIGMILRSQTLRRSQISKILKSFYYTVRCHFG